MVICAFEIRAPEGSVTTPTMAPRSTCAAAGIAAIRRKPKQRQQDDGIDMAKHKAPKRDSQITCTSESLFIDSTIGYTLGTALSRKKVPDLGSALLSFD